MSYQSNTLIAALLGASVLLSSCGGGTEPSSTGGKPGLVVSAAHRQEALNQFNTVCAACHGTTGHGDGPASVGLDPKPRSFSDKQWQATIDDEHVRKVITLGGAAVGKSPIMPPQPQLKSQPEVLQALVDIVRSYAK